jgi:23S rRNA pseudouridine2605 synthase
MPPRFAYWTIIVEGKPTAFRAQDRDDLIPTFKQLQSKHPDAVMMWFARGRLWPSPEAARAAEQRGGAERRNKDWRPGGEHRDPRARFDVPRDEKRRRFAERMRRDQRDRSGAPQNSEWRPKPDRRPPRQDRPPGDRPWRPKPEWTPKPSGAGDRSRFETRGDRPPREDRGPRPPRQDENRGDRPWRPNKPDWKPKPPGARGPKPEWKPRPAGAHGLKPEWKPKAPGARGPKPEWKPKPPGAHGPRSGGGGQGRPSGFRPRGPGSRGPGNQGPGGRGPGGKPPGRGGRGGGGSR